MMKRDALRRQPPDRTLSLLSLRSPYYETKYCTSELSYHDISQRQMSLLQQSVERCHGGLFRQVLHRL